MLQADGPTPVHDNQIGVGGVAQGEARAVAGQVGRGRKRSRLRAHVGGQRRVVGEDGGDGDRARIPAHLQRRAEERLRSGDRRLAPLLRLQRVLHGDSLADCRGDALRHAAAPGADPGRSRRRRRGARADQARAGQDGRRLRRHRLQRLRRAAGTARRAHGRRGARASRSARCCATTCSSRARAAPTAGVHAWGQVASFPSEPGLDPWRLQAAVTSMLGPEIVIRSAELRRPAVRRPPLRARRARTATRSSTGPVPDPFRDRFTWWVPEPLDLRALRLAADPFVGEHDFASFCRKGPEGSSTTRRVLESRWVDEGDGVLRYEIRGNAFCWQLVRSIVGTLVEVGPRQAPAGRHDGDHPRAGPRRGGAAAPPRGLCLWEVGY